MSLAPQRPNYVLIWIGIVMFTFSMVGNWVLDSSSSKTSNIIGSTRSNMDYEDSALLPVHGNMVSNPPYSTALAAEDTFDQMVPLFEEEISLKENSLANQEIPLGPLEWTLLPIEAVELEQEAAERTEQEDRNPGLVSEKLPSAEPQGQLHSYRVRQTQDSALNQRQKTTDRFQNQTQYDSTSRNLGLAGKGKPKLGSDRSILVKSVFTPRDHGKIAVRFFLEHPAASGQALDRLPGLGEESTRLALMAETYFAAMEEVILEDDSAENDADSEELRHKRIALKRLAEMKSKIRERLQQRLGGIELLAELSPEQLEALLQKLSAQDPRFRALVNS
ncbi:MAG: hypothetical protein O3A95_01190 [Planctomycetota bacterium]|nr:hypothetical protein [Planctomycetota bacterium]MDA1112900.1 hypothetical protein [Planctomycetota bacterium]